MEQTILVDPSMAGIPAPHWFTQFFTWLGFTLHTVPMNLWYAGFLVALLLHLGGNAHARRFASRLLQQMPVIVAFGVNFGIVPLLFIQLAYFKVFYPTTILMAWFWMAIILLLIPAYYGVYAYASGLCDETAPFAKWRIVAGWCAMLFFITIGFLFANGLSLMEHVDRWSGLWRASNHSGATLGVALNVGDPSLWPRWLLMFGLALGTTAVWVLVDAFFLTNKPTDADYRQWALGFAKKLYTFGAIWTGAAGSWYVFGTWPEVIRSQMFHGSLAVLTVATAIAPGLPLLLIWRAKTGGMVALTALSQFGVLGINAASRQIVQNLSLRPTFDVFAQPIDVQWSPMAMFLIVFVLGLGIVAWMLLQLRGQPTART